MRDNETAIAVRKHPENTGLSIWNQEELEVIKNLICPGASDSELALFAKVCQRTGLDAFSRQIYGIMRNTRKQVNGVWVDDPKLTIQTSIDGFRLSAQRSGEYGGQVGPEWCGTDRVWRDVWLEDYPPAAARVGVLRKGWTQPTWAVATWQEYAQTNKDGKPTGMWKNMPANQLAKCAESLALRKGFPQELSGLLTKDEMEQAERPEGVATYPGPQLKVVTGEVIDYCDADHWNKTWHATVKGSRFEDDELRHKWMSLYTKGSCSSLADFLAGATTDEAVALIAGIEKTLAAEARKAAAATTLKNVTPERADLNLQLRAAVSEANDLGGAFEVPKNLDDLSDDDVRSCLATVVDAIESVRAVPA